MSAAEIQENPGRLTMLLRSRGQDEKEKQGHTIDRD